MIRSGYSFKVAYGHLDEVASRLIEIGWSHQPLIDRNSTFGFNRWTKLVPRPVYGVEIGVVSVMAERRPRADFWRFLACDGLKPLHDLIEMATNNPGEPSLLYSDAINAPGLIKIAGSRALLECMVPNEDIYIALSPSLPIGLYRAAQKASYNFVATSDNVYPREGDLEAYRIALGRRAGTQTYPQHILTDDEWHEACWQFQEHDRNDAIMLRDYILECCTAQLEKATLFRPERPMTLRKMCEQGAVAKCVNLEDKVYADRLTRELTLIAEKNFEDYFYIIADIVQWAKKRMIVGPARGSSCGSLVCFLLDITAVDPLQFDLIFERFIDINRSDLPDIDIDFSDAQRDQVFEYVEEKYGTERVARLGTTGMFHPKSAINAVGAALRIPTWKTAKVMDGLIQRSLGDSRARQCLEDTLKDTEAGRNLLAEMPEVIIGARLEGHPSYAGQHAAGLCITQDAINRYVAVDKRNGTVMCDKKDAEDFNMLKIDMLGLTQLSIFERTLEMIGEMPINGFLERLPLDDQAAFDVLNRGHYSGVFQFNGGALQSLSKQIAIGGAPIDKIEDIIAITALARPGPLNSGSSHTWVMRRLGEWPIEYPHPIFEPYLRNTLGTVIYQEQVLSIGREVGDLSWADVTDLRKSMSRSLGKEYFNQWGDRWKAGAMKRGVPAAVADKFWDDMCQYGSWAFNRAHAVAYGLVSYYCCWLKAHYPLEFAAATLDAENLPFRQIMILRELKAEQDIDYIPVDPFNSEHRWTITERDGKKVLLGPLTLIKGIGPATMNEILIARRTGQPLNATIAKKLVNAKTAIDSLYPVTDAVKRLHPDLKAIGIHSAVTPIKSIEMGYPGDVVVIAVATKIAPKDENETINVVKRGYALTGPTAALNLFVRDDSDEIFCKVDRRDYEQFGRTITETGRVGKSLYAIKGRVPRSFRMISISQVKYLGEIEDFDGSQQDLGGTYSAKGVDTANTGMD
jgi:DNA polymerase III alpha subunit